jgi:hypothetical protein
MTLEAGHGVGRPAELPSHARLDLDEDDGRAVAGDDVQFATPQPVAAGNNCVPATFELATREILADFTERLPGTRHRGCCEQKAHHNTKTLHHEVTMNTKTLTDNISTTSQERRALTKLFFVRFVSSWLISEI